MPSLKQRCKTPLQPVNTHAVSSDWLCRSYMTVPFWGHCRLEKQREYHAAMPLDATCNTAVAKYHQLTLTTIPTCSCHSGSVLYEMSPTQPVKGIWTTGQASAKPDNFRLQFWSKLKTWTESRSENLHPC